MSGVRKAVNIIGGGNVGRSLARLWHQHGVFTIGDILNRTPASAQLAAEFIGEGRASATIDEMKPADVWLIAVSDDRIRFCCEQLAASHKLRPGAVVFHCSGALPSGELKAARAQGAAIASIHPIRSFANPEHVATAFDGTWCGIEGEPAALEILAPAFEAIGARLVTIDAGAKTVYHSAAVFACNYLVTLLDTAVKAYGAAGVPQDVALQMMEPLVRGTIDNVFRSDPAAALTGPIARGDLATAQKQSRAVNAWNDDYGALYDQFMKLTIELARKKM
ncbi:MAG TPA: Rossmann-like and DUF2520 domain-containing protein [Noviherbaspirillum sp.]